MDGAGCGEAVTRDREAVMDEVIMAAAESASGAEGGEDNRTVIAPRPSLARIHNGMIISALRSRNDVFLAPAYSFFRILAPAQASIPALYCHFKMQGGGAGLFWDGSGSGNLQPGAGSSSW